MIPYTKHDITDQDIALVVDVLRSPRLTQGPVVEAFEKAFAAKVGAKYCVAVNSGTAALHLAYLACGIEPGDTVVTSPVTFVATANAALYCGADVRFVDVDRDTGMQCAFGIDNDLIVGVSLGGQDSFYPVNNTPYVMDACHGPYTLPPRALAACFSFHPAKHIAAGEGGAICTNDKGMWLELQVLRDHGRDDLRKMVFLGFNYRMDEMSAALALSQLGRLDATIARRREIAAIYDAEFKDHVQTVPHSRDSARHLYQLLVDERDRVRVDLAARGVGSQVHYHPIVPLQPYYRKRFGYRLGQWPNAEWHAAHTLSIPLFPSMTDGEIATVIRAVKEVT